MSDIFDSRDLLDELKTLDKIDDLDRIAEIEELIEEVGRDNFEMGVTVIREGYWVDYCEDMAYEFGFLDRQDDNNPFTKSALKDFFTVLALSFHSVFEGLAVGLETESKHIWMLFAGTTRDYVYPWFYRNHS